MRERVEGDMLTTMTIVVMKMKTRQERQAHLDVFKKTEKVKESK